MKQPHEGSSHQPARECRGSSTFRARRIPHRTMGAAILEHTKEKDGPGPLRAGPSRADAPPPRFRQLVRPGTAWQLLFGPQSKSYCMRCGVWCIPGWEAQAPPAAAALSEVSAAWAVKEGRDGTQGTSPQRTSLWRNNSASVIYGPGAAERALALWLCVAAAVAPGCRGRRCAWEP